MHQDSCSYPRFASDPRARAGGAAALSAARATLGRPPAVGVEGNGLASRSGARATAVKARARLALRAESRSVPEVGSAQREGVQVVAGWSSASKHKEPYGGSLRKPRWRRAALRWRPLLTSSCPG